MSISRRSPSLVLIAILLSGFSFGLIIFWFGSNNRFTGFSEQISFSSSSPSVSDTIDDKREQDSLFRQYLKKGEDLYLKNELNQAIMALEMAQKINPNDVRLKERITIIKEKLSEQNQNKNEYNKAIASGDTYFNAKDYLNAKASYQIAIDNRPEDTLAKSKLRKTMDLLRSQKAQNILYDVAVASADKLFQEKDYDRARIEYENASKILPKDQYPRNKINEIIKIQIDKQVNDELYDKAIANGDKFFLNKNYQSSLLEFQKAQGIRPEELYPKQKITDLIFLIADQKTKDEAYNKAILLADQLFQQTKYAESVKGYQQALTVKPDEIYPKTKIREIENILATRKKQQEEYDFYMALADSLYIEKSFFTARENYSRASAIKPLESYPKDMISKTDKMLTGQEAEMAKIMAIEEQYRLSIVSADKMFDQKQYDAAKTDYQKAAGYKPTEPYPKSKITEIDSILSSLVQIKNREGQYDSLILLADKELAALAYDLARNGYQKALALKSTEPYPKSKIAEINKLLQGIAQQKLADEKYKSTIIKADSLFALKAYEQAQTEYQNALKIKDAEIYPTTKLAEISQILTLLAKEKAFDDQYSALIFKGKNQIQSKEYPVAKKSFEAALQLKPEEKFPKDQIAAIDSILASIAKQKALDDQYDLIITKGDQLLVSKSYDQARIEYVNAGNLKPSEQYPVDRIAEIDKLLGEVATKKALDEQYAKTIVDADKLFVGKTYDQARSLYVKSGDLKSSETYPRTRISEIDIILGELAKQKALDEEYKTVLGIADSLYSEKAFEMARIEYLKASGLKSAEPYPKTRITEIDKQLADLASRKALDDQYASVLAVADRFFGEKKYDQARASYIDAGKIKPSELYPKEKITEIGTILAELAKQKALDDQYNLIITKGDQLLVSKSYDQARIEYVNAGNLKPSEQYPVDRIAEIDKLLGEVATKKALDEQYAKTIVDADKLFVGKTYDQARSLYVKSGDLKSSETYPRTRISEIDIILGELAKQKALDEEYKTVLGIADSLYSEKAFEMARIEYLKASGLKSAEPYPKTRITEIDKQLADLASRKALDDQYASVLAVADRFFGEKKYDQARASYIDAGKIKPSELYPKEKITEIGTILAELAKQKALDDQYNLIITKGDQLLVSKSYDQARIEYVNAGKLKPTEQYPKDKLTEIDGILNEIKLKEEAYRTSVTNADQLFAEKKYEESSDEYQNALIIKPDAKYPADKIIEINRILTELKGKRQTYEELVAKGETQFTQKEWVKAKSLFQQALTVLPEEKYPKERINQIGVKIDSIYRANKVRYDQAVEEGDRFYNSYEYDKAIDSYTVASELLTMENYPREMIFKIRRTITENAIVDVLNSPVTLRAGEEKQFPFTPVNMASRKNNFIYIKIRNLSDKPFNVLLRYGQDKQSGGGVVIRNLSPDGKISERLISVRDQDTWYRFDNNWISLYPQGGDIEVTFIQVSRAQRQ